jgi:hypothetical protein
MRKKLAALAAAAFVAALVASPVMAKSSSDGRAGSTIIARN